MELLKKLSDEKFIIKNTNWFVKYRLGKLLLCDTNQARNYIQWMDKFHKDVLYNNLNNLSVYLEVLNNEVITDKYKIKILQITNKMNDIYRFL